MKIITDHIGRRFSTEWIFRNFSYAFEADQAYAILGSNGSGKSTLLQLLAGKLLPSDGSITYEYKGAQVPNDKIFRHLGIAAPYLEIFEEFTLEEILSFHFGFKKLMPGIQRTELAERMELNAAGDKRIFEFSSGMKQRLKLGLAILSRSEILLLDEPVSNLDSKGITWYRELIGNFSSGRIIIVCSNHNDNECGFCKNIINVEDFK